MASQSHGGSTAWMEVSPLENRKMKRHQLTSALEKLPLDTSPAPRISLSNIAVPQSLTCVPVKLEWRSPGHAQLSTDRVMGPDQESNSGHSPDQAEAGKRENEGQDEEWRLACPCPERQGLPSQQLRYTNVGGSRFNIFSTALWGQPRYVYTLTGTSHPN